MSTDGGPRRLYREPEDRKVAGVCAGLGDYLGVDPTVVRLLVVILTLSNWFVGVVVYLIAAAIVPQRPDDQPRVRAPRPLLPESSTTPVIVGLLILAGITLIRGTPWLEAPFVAVAFLGLGAWLLLRDREFAESSEIEGNITQSVPTGTASATTLVTEAAPERGLPSQSDHTLDVAGDTTQDDDHATRIPSFVPDDSALRAGSQGEVPPPVPPWELGSPVVTHDYTPAILCLLVGGVALLTLFDVVTLNYTTASAWALVGIGVLLVTGAWRGRRRWLIGLGVPVIALLLLDESMGVPLSEGIGERKVIVDEPGVDRAESRKPRLAIGELTVDLRQVDDDGPPVKIDGELGLGELIVIVPDDMTAEIDAHVELGAIDRPGLRDVDEGADIDERFTVEADPDTPEARERHVELDLEVGLGELTVRRG